LAKLKTEHSDFWQKYTLKIAVKKEKYHYNLKTLQYEKVESSWQQRILRFLVIVLAFVISGVFITAIYTFYFDSPLEKFLKQEIAVNQQEMELLKRELEEMQAVLENLRERDVNTYRVIYEAEPIESSLWEAGIGGSSRYKELEKFSTGELMIDLRRKVDELRLKMAWQSKSYDELAVLVSQKGEMLESLPAIQPVANKDLKRMASGYGWRIDPVYGVKRFHSGMDFSAPIGTEVYATGKGVIEEVVSSRIGYGKMIIINHGFGYKTLYAHLDDFAVKKNDKVVRGQLIGYVGNTGKSVGPHLHYEVIKRGQKVNPVFFYYQDLDEEQYEEMIRMSENAGSSLD
jgi:murein DD-endopeptidase MepM/ murein hydrolase activator NlpD